MSFFAVDDLGVSFGGIRAVDGVSFAVEAGQVFTIIGPNGAGKTTIFNLISRIYDPTDGRLTFRDEDITRVPPHEIARGGIARTFPTIELFERSKDAVVFITTTQRVLDPWSRNVFRMPRGTGSGFVIDTEGQTPEESAQAVIAKLEELGLVPAGVNA